MNHGVSIPPVFSMREEMDALFLACVKQGVSDIYINTGRPLTADVWGRMHTLTKRRIGQSEALALSDFLMSEGVRARVISGFPQPAAYAIMDPHEKAEDGGQLRHRFRINVSRIRYKAEWGIQAVIRVLQSTPPILKFEDELEHFGYVPGQVSVPRRMFDGMLAPDGLTLISGATGSGKTTLFAAALRFLGEWEDSPIRGNICIGEQPVEFVFEQVQSSHSEFVQQAVGEDVDSFASFVRDLMRRHPALGVIGEIRDTETTDAAMQLALTGHPAWGTVHANDVPAMIPRLLTQYSPEARPAAMANLLGSTRMLINQSLAQTVDGKRTAIRSYLELTAARRKRLESCKGIQELEAAIREMLMKEGVSKTAAAKEALERGLISEQVAARIAAGESE